MFFPEPERAFANIRAALRPNGRAAFMVWQEPAHNPWIRFVMGAFPEIETPLPNPDDGPGPFALSSADRVRSIFSKAGYSKVELDPFSTKVQHGPTVDDVMESAAHVGPLSRLLEEAPEEKHPELLDRLRAFLEKQYEGGPPALDAAVWIIRASR
jgi:hypothetical protein